MHYILPAREVIADSVEIMAKVNRLQGIVLIGSCDKIVPGLLMAAARIDDERAEELKDQAAIIADSGLLEQLQKEEAVAEEMNLTSGEENADAGDADAAGEESIEKQGE